MEGRDQGRDFMCNVFWQTSTLIKHCLKQNKWTNRGVFDVSPPNALDLLQSGQTRLRNCSRVLRKKVKVILSHRSEKNKMDRDINTDNLIMGLSPIDVFKTGSEKKKKMSYFSRHMFGRNAFVLPEWKERAASLYGQRNKERKGIVHPKSLPFTTHADVDGGSW